MKYSFKRHITKLIQELPEQERLILSLYYCEELTHIEIADLLGTTPAKVISMYERALEALSVLRAAPKISVDNPGA